MAARTDKVLALFAHASENHTTRNRLQEHLRPVIRKVCGKHGLTPGIDLPSAIYAEVTERAIELFERELRLPSDEHIEFLTETIIVQNVGETGSDTPQIASGGDTAIEKCLNLLRPDEAQLLESIYGRQPDPVLDRETKLAHLGALRRLQECIDGHANG